MSQSPVGFSTEPRELVSNVILTCNCKTTGYIARWLELAKLADSQGNRFLLIAGLGGNKPEAVLFRDRSIARWLHCGFCMPLAPSPLTGEGGGVGPAIHSNGGGDEFRFLRSENRC